MSLNRRCMYCGRQRRLTKEHIIPEALGGRRWRKSVCQECNNTVLSRLDKELSERSPLSVIAAFELQKKTTFSWDVDHEDDNLLLEAWADDKSQSMTQWPQMVFDDAGPQLHGDAEEIQEFGWENFQHLFIKHMLGAFHSVKSGAKRPRIVFERVPTDIPPIYRYPPRIFATRKITDFHHSMRFQCRYRTKADKRRILHALDTWDVSRRFRSFEVRLGSSLPAFKTNFELTTVLRALVKLGINALHLACDKTAVDRQSFSKAIKVVTGEIPVPANLLASNGFVFADDLKSLECPINSHRLRLLYDDRKGFWKVYLAFFGGRAGAFVTFPGPSREKWCTADITAPTDSARWVITKSAIYQALSVRIEWLDMKHIAPSVPLVNTTSNVTAVTRPLH